MARRRSSFALLCALAAMLAMPAAAVAQGDPTLPVNTTDPTPGAVWTIAPYEVEVSGTDVEDAAVDMQWRLAPAGAITTVPSGSIVTVGDQGQHDFQTRAVDDSGNDSGWRSEPLWIDTVRPTDATTVSNAWFGAPLNVDVHAVDVTSGVLRVEWILDGAPIQSGPNHSPVAISGDGVHLLRTRAVDVAGNVSGWTDHTIRVDTVVPTDTTAIPSGWQTAPLNVSVTGADAHSGVTQVTWQIDGGTPTTAPAPSAFTASAEGEYAINTRVRDAAGNQSGWKAHPVKIDTTAPTNQTPVSSGTWSTADYSVLVNGADGLSGVADVQWRIDAGPWSSGPPGSQVNVQGTGDHTLETRVRDVAGNSSLARLDHVRIDRVPPANTTTAAPPTSGNPYTVAVTGTDAHSGIATIQWQVDGGTVHTGLPGDTATVSGHGVHTLMTRVIDAAGNAVERTETVTVNAVLGDTTAPADTTTTASPDWQLAAIDVTVAATDAQSGVKEVQWRLDGQATKSSLQDDPSFTISAEGDHLLETRAIDMANNRSTWRVQHFKIDLSVPVDATDIPAGWTTDAGFTLSGTDTYSGIDEFEYTIDGGPDQTGAAGQHVAVAGDGEYEIELRVIDNAGHASAYRTATLRVDRTDPVNTTAVPSSAWSAEPLELELSGTDARSGLEVMQWRVDGGTTHDGGPAVVDADGEHVLETRAVDAAGNATDWRAGTVRIDATAPANTTPAAPAGWRTTAYSVVVGGDDGAGSGVDKIEHTVDGGAVSEDENVTIAGDGVHVLRTRVVDNVGHASAWREETIRIDSAAPSAALACDGGDGWSRSAVTCAVSADGGVSGLSELTLSRNGGTAEPVAAGSTVEVSGDGAHALALSAEDGAGNQRSASATVHVDRTAPTAGLTCTAAGTTHTCRVDAADATSGLAAAAWRVDGGEWKAIAAGGTFTVSKGKVAARAVDGAGNELVTAPVTLAPAKDTGTTVKIFSAPVHLAGRDDSDGLVGALAAARSANGTVSIDLRPLAVGRGRYNVQIKLQSGKRRKTFERTYTVGRTGALPRIATSLAKATRRCTVTLTVRKRVGRKWRRYAGTRLVLPT